jgi:lipoate synthase
MQTIPLDMIRGRKRRSAELPRVPKPDWLKVRAPGSENYHRLKGLMRTLGLNTVCEEANCPNIGECWHHGTATFMILGDTCTRSCGYCNVLHGTPKPPDEQEPVNVALELLDRSRRYAPAIPTKSGLMVGLGEEWDEVVMTMRDLRQAGVQIVTIGQYLRPSLANLPMVRYYTPAEFAELKRLGLEMGFGHVESGPLVRSSYHAHEQTASYESRAL